MMAGFFGTTELSFRACFRGSKAALRGQNFVQKFAQTFEGGRSVAVGEIGERTEASIKCVRGAGKGSTFFAIDVASITQGEAADLARKLLEALLPAGEVKLRGNGGEDQLRAGTGGINGTVVD
jgi:hypothetical protein